MMYGHNPHTFTNHIYTLNLMTFELKEITFEKKYSPGNRTHFWAYCSDHRLYVTGGVDK